MKVVYMFLIMLMMAGTAVVTPAQGQLLKRLKDRAQQQVENKVNQRADQAVDQAVDKAADGIEDAAQSAFEKKMAASRTPVDMNLGPNATSPSNAPQFQYRNTTLMDLGALGALTRIMGQDLGSTQSTVFMSGYRQRTDDGETSTIVDAQSGELITINHAKKEYSQTTFQAMMDKFQSQMEEATSQSSEAGTDSGDGSDMDMKFDVTFDRPGRVQDIYGVQAEQVVMSIRSDVTATDEEGTYKGTFYSVVDMWLTEGLAGMETMKSFQEQLAGTVGTATGAMGQSAMGGMLTVMGQDPRMSGSWEKAAEEMRDVQGYPVQSTMHFVIVPEGQALDMDLVFAETESGGSNMDALVRMAEQQNGEGGEQTVQATMFKITSQVSDLQVGGFDESYLQVPEGYTQVASPY